MYQHSTRSLNKRPSQIILIHSLPTRLQSSQKISWKILLLLAIILRSNISFGFSLWETQLWIIWGRFEAIWSALWGSIKRWRLSLFCKTTPDEIPTYTSQSLYLIIYFFSSDAIASSGSYSCLCAQNELCKLVWIRYQRFIISAVSSFLLFFLKNNLSVKNCILHSLVILCFH